jgi:hypothetical protein
MPEKKEGNHKSENTQESDSPADILKIRKLLFYTPGRIFAIFASVKKADLVVIGV